MKTELFSLALIGLLVNAVGYNPKAAACGLPGQSLEVLARQAISENTPVSAMAIPRLRSVGPAGLDALLKANAAMIQRHPCQPAAIESSEQSRGVDAAESGRGRGWWPMRLLCFGSVLVHGF
jgi:hypothetical protein